LKIIGNYTAVAMHNQSKTVGKKPSGSKRKVSATKKPDVHTITDPFSWNPEVSNCSEEYPDSPPP